MTIYILTLYLTLAESLKNPNLDMKKKMSATKFVISIAGKEGDSGTIFSS